MNDRIRIVLFSLFCYLISTVVGMAAPVSGIKFVVRELVEIVSKKGGSLAGRELAEWGGEKAVTELAEKVMNVGGDTALKRLRQHVTAHGMTSLKAIEMNPGRLIQVLEDIPESMIGKVFAAINHDPATMNRLLTGFGSEALQFAAKHPGIGADICDRLGKEGMRAAAGMNASQVVRLHRLLPRLSELDDVRRSRILDLISEAPARMLSFLEKHPKVLLTGAGVAVMVNYREALLGGDELVENPDGSYRVISRPGLFGRTAENLLHHPVSGNAMLLISGCLGLGLFIRFSGRVLLQVWELRNRKKRETRNLTYI